MCEGGYNKLNRRDSFFSPLFLVFLLTLLVTNQFKYGHYLENGMFCDKNKTISVWNSFVNSIVMSCMRVCRK